MGEIILSFVIGGCLVAAGIFLNKWLSREEKRTAKADVADRGDSA